MQTIGIKREPRINSAMREAIEENKEIFFDIIADVLEDIAFGKAIEEGLEGERVSVEEIMKVLHS